MVSAPPQAAFPRSPTIPRNRQVVHDLLTVDVSAPPGRHEGEYEIRESICENLRTEPVRLRLPIQCNPSNRAKHNGARKAEERPIDIPQTSHVCHL